MEWFLENVLALIKCEYVPEKNYYYLHTNEKGKKIARSFIVHRKIISEMKEMDKRKVDKTSRLGHVLATIFQRIKIWSMFMEIIFLI